MPIFSRAESAELVSVLLCDILAVHQDPTRRRLDEPVNVAHQRRFPAARQAHDAEDLAGFDRKRDVGDTDHTIEALEDGLLVEPLTRDGVERRSWIGAVDLPYVGADDLAVSLGMARRAAWCFERPSCQSPARLRRFHHALTQRMQVPSLMARVLALFHRNDGVAIRSLADMTKKTPLHPLNERQHIDSRRFESLPCGHPSRHLGAMTLHAARDTFEKAKPRVPVRMPVV